MPWKDVCPMDQRRQFVIDARASPVAGPSSAPATASAARPATSGSPARRPRAWTVSTSTPAGRAAVPTPPLRSSSRRSWKHAAGIRAGARGSPELIEPAKPQQNGRHERMHRTLKRETARPPAGSHQAQQRRFNAFRLEFNHERSHEALGDDTPASRHRPAPRRWPARLPPLEYPNHFEVRLVSANGGIRWQPHWVNVSHVLGGEYVGLEEVDDGEWDLYFGPLKLGRFHERLFRVEDALGRLRRRRPLPMSLD